MWLLLLRRREFLKVRTKATVLFPVFSVALLSGGAAVDVKIEETDGGVGLIMQRVVGARRKRKHRSVHDLCGAGLAKKYRTLSSDCGLFDYDQGREGIELPRWVWPRAQMPWHPKEVPAIMREGMLVSLEHMQIHVVSCCSGGPGKFHRSVISFWSELSVIVVRRGLGRGSRVNDRVKLICGPCQDLYRRPLKAWELDVTKKVDHVVTLGGDLSYSALVEEVMLDGMLPLDSDQVRVSCEQPWWVWPRAQTSWHRKEVPLVLKLCSELCREVVLGGLHVRSWYVSRLLRVLCAYVPNGRVWRIGGHGQELMHKFYDPRMLDVLDDSATRCRFDRASDVTELLVELKTAEEFSIAGFRVKFAEPESFPVCESHRCVELKIFCTLLQLGNLQLSEVVASWWTGLSPIETSGWFSFVI